MAAEVVEGFQLSPQQRRLWSLQQGSYDPVFRTQGTVRIDGDLRPEILRAALENTIRRHEILRTTFHHLPGLSVPVQVVNESVEFGWEVHDLQCSAAPEREAKLDVILGERRQFSVGLKEGPLFQSSLVTLAPTRHLLHLSTPAVCADAATLVHLVREISRAYAALMGNGEIADEPIQFADLAQWQNELLESEDGKSGREFWRRQISDFASVKLPVENEPPPGAAFRPRSFKSKIHPDVAAKLERLAASRQTSVSSILLTCWQVLLWRLSGQSAFVLGTGCDGRTYDELSQSLGLFAKYLPLPCRLADESPFGELLRRTDELLGEAIEWQEYFSWEQIAESAPNVTSSSFFPVGFDFEKRPEKCLAGELTFSLNHDWDDSFAALDKPLAVSACVERLSLKLTCVQTHDGLIAAFHYDSNRFQTANIERLAEQFHVLATSVVESPDAPIGKLNIMDEAERHRLLVEFNSTTTDFSGSATAPDADCIHHLIEQQVARVPNRVAVTCDGQQLSYAEFNARANQLAHHLRALGVGPDVLVGLCCQRSVEMLVGIYGILKAGGAYVPLDPAYPKERLAFMLEDTRSPVLLTQQKLVENLPGHGARVVYLDSGWTAIARESRENPARNSGRQNLAYVIYTSGSTGQPKGVPISHQNLVHSTRARMVYYREPITAYLLLPSFAFDSSVAGIFWTLCLGGTLVLPQDGIEREPTELAALIAQHRISHLVGLPSVYRLLLTAAKPLQLASIRTAIVAGEPCPIELVAQHRQTLSHSELFNEYGPTEGTVWSTVYDCLAEEVNQQVPIGRPIANMQVYLLDRHRNPVPIGATGELHIAGPGVARGYLNREDLTAERFFNNPFSANTESRLYKTGDLARYRPDGVIEFLGRIDEQVKVRGYRIELGEIESVLRQHPAAADAVVVVRSDSAGDKRIVAYLVPGVKATPTVSELRRFLLEKLPEYMVPSAFMFLRNLPLTPNGKVDRQALPEPDQTRPELDSAFVAPRSELERLLATTWSEVLGLEKVGLNDGFFELGGSSIQAAIIINKLQTRLGEFMHVATLFRHPRLAEFASYLQEHYSEAVATLVGSETVDRRSSRHRNNGVDASRVAQIRRLITPLPDRESVDAGPKNPPAVFILCSPRSGSTLLRVMLAGNPRLFAPPEIELLNFNTLAERKAVLTGPEKFWDEGLLRALMEIKGCDLELARRIVEDHVTRSCTTKEFYRQLQDWLGARLLVDKTACYSLDPKMLQRAEEDFDNPLYIHLLRHPSAMIRSFEKVRLDEVFFRYEHSFAPRELAELVWIVSHQNILDQLSNIPAHRQCRVRFEDLVKEPEVTLKAICQRLGVPFDPEMVRPYDNQKMKMTDGASEFSKMQGDPKFHEHRSIDSSVATQWQTDHRDDFFGEITCRLAETFGYEMVQTRRPSPQPTLRESAPIQSIPQNDATLRADVNMLSNEEVRSLLEKMMVEEGTND